MSGFHEWNDRSGGQRRRVEIVDHAGTHGLGNVVSQPLNTDLAAVLVENRLVKSRHVGPIHGGCNPGELVFSRERRVALHGFPEVAHDRQAGLAVADDEQINERREQLGILRAGPAGNHQGVVVAPLIGMEGNAAKVEHGENIGVADFVLKREPNHIEFAQRRERFQAVQGQFVVAERLLEIRQGREGTLASPAEIVHQAVEDLEAMMTHPQGIGIRERQTQRSATGLMILGDAVTLPSDILGRCLDARQDS